MISLPTRKPVLPKQPVKPYIHPKVKAMTIGVGFESVDGVILGADRQMTRPGFNKFFEQKLFHNVNSRRALALVGAGDLALAKEVWNKLIDTGDLDSVESVKERFESILNDMGRLYADLPIELLLGVATDQSTELIEFRGKGIQKVEDFAVIGCADTSLIRYLADRIHRFFIEPSQAIIAAAYLLKRAEKYIDGCHGPMDILMLSVGPQIRSIDPNLVDFIDHEIEKNQQKTFRDLLSVSWTLPT